MFPAEFSEINTDLHIWKVFCLLNIPVTVKNFSLPGVVSYFSLLISNSLPTCFPYPAFWDFFLKRCWQRAFEPWGCVQRRHHIYREQGDVKRLPCGARTDPESGANHSGSGGLRKNHVFRCLGNIYLKLIKNCDLIERQDGFTD